MTQPKRLFVGWERPFVESVAQHLLERAGGPRAADLSDTVVVLPGSRAVRALEARLAALCSGPWRPPRVVTEGGLPSALRRAAPPTAARAVRLMLWAETLRELSPRDLALLLGRAPRPGDLRGWLRVGARFERVLAALAAEDRSADDAAAVSVGSSERWTVVRSVSERVAERLDAVGLIDPALAARSARTAPDLVAGARVLLAGLAEVPMATRRLLQAAATEVHAAVFAPEECGPGFDEWGAVDAAWWLVRGARVPDASVTFIDGPGPLARDLAVWLAALPAGTPLNAVTVGLLDEDLEPALRAELAAVGLDLRLGAGRPASRGCLARLMEACLGFLRDRRFAELAAIARHPWLDARWSQGLGSDAGPVDFASRLDAFAHEHVPYRASSERLAHGGGDGSEFAAPVLAWLGPLAGDEVRPLVAWCGELRGMFAALPEAADEELGELDQALEGLEALATGDGSSLRGDAALELVLSAFGDQRLPSPTGPNSLEALGWLELPLDTAPNLYLAGVTSSRLPEPLPREVLLPDAARVELGLPCDESRRARDAYWLESLCASRPGLRLAAARRTSRGDPLRPSRLLTLCEPETLMRRVREFFQEPKPARIAGAGPREGSWRPSIPALPPVERLHVSAIDAFLDSPFQYALRYGIGLETVLDEPRELDARAFGNLIHEVLEAFGRGSARHSPDEARILASVTDALDRLLERRFDEGVQPAVPLQLEELRARLTAFARVQARLVSEGWRIEQVEQDAPERPFDVDGTPVLLRGRVDRIDRHATTGVWRVIDYKTGESGDGARKAHGPITKGARKGQWRKLQLVLYREMFLERFEGTEPELGYLLLPKDVEGTRFDAASWTADELDAALEVARDVVRRIRAGAFEERGDRVPEEPILAALAGCGVPDQLDGADADGEEASS